jgi:hypothetical protein
MRLPMENEGRLSQTIAAPSYEPTGPSRIAARANGRQRTTARGPIRPAISMALPRAARARVKQL